MSGGRFILWRSFGDGRHRGKVLLLHCSQLGQRLFLLSSNDPLFHLSVEITILFLTIPDMRTISPSTQLWAFEHVMTTELRILVASIFLGLVHLIAASHLISFQYGYRWTAGSREEPVPPLRGLANRVDQATTNFLETFPFFAAAVLAAQLIGHHSPLTVLGAHLYFWARVGYLLAATAGFGLIRSVLFWNTALTGIVLLLIAILL
jgi:uncharacterized MAPEG superfamily protein